MEVLKNKLYVRCSLSHIEDLGKPRRLGPIAAFVNKDKDKYNCSSFQWCFFLRLYVKMDWKDEYKILEK